MESCKLHVVGIDFEAAIERKLNDGFNVSEIDERDEEEIQKFFDEEYIPNYEIVKHAMIRASHDSGVRYFFNEPAGCSRLYGVHITEFEDSDMNALIRGFLAVDCFKRESAFGANIEFTDDRGNRCDANIFYIARNRAVLAYPSAFGILLQQAIQDFRC